MLPSPVLQDDDRALDRTSSAWVSLLVSLQAMLQCVAHDALQTAVNRGVGLDVPLQEILDAQVRIQGCELVKDLLDDSRRLEGRRRTGHDDRQRSSRRVRPLLISHEPLRRHELQNLVSAPQDPRCIVEARRIVARRLGDARQQRRRVRILDGEARQRPAEVVLRRSRKPVLAVSHVDEAHVPSKDLFLRAALRSVSLPHLLFEPHGEPHLLTLPGQHVDAARPDHGRQRASREAGRPELVAVLQRRQAAEKLTTHELLGDGGAALRKDRGAVLLVVLTLPHHAPHHAVEPGLAEHARHAEVVDAIVREEPLVLSGQNRVTHDRRDVLIARDVPVLPGERDDRLAVGVVDVTNGRKLEPHQRPQVGHVLAIEIDAVPGTQSEQRDTQ